MDASRRDAWLRPCEPRDCRADRRCAARRDADNENAQRNRRAGRRGVRQTGSAAEPAIEEQTPPETADIINGSTIYGAATLFAQPRAFGNNRPRLSSLYNGGVNVALGNSAWNATPYSFTNPSPPAPSYDDLQLGFNFGGPLRIPWVVKYGPQTFLNVQHSVFHNATTHSALMPTAAERAGDFSQSGVVIRDPRTGLPFEGNVIPFDRISPQAAALLTYCPLPNAPATSGANYQTPIVASVQRDSLQANVSKSLRPGTSLAGSFSFERSETDSVYSSTSPTRVARRGSTDRSTSAAG